jgi:parallel beta-helix repeat protein
MSKHGNEKLVFSVLLIVFVLLLGFSIGAQVALNSSIEIETSNPVKEYLQENYGVSNVEELKLLFLQQTWQNHTDFYVSREQYKDGTVRPQYARLYRFSSYFFNPFIQLSTVSLLGLVTLGALLIPFVRKRKWLKYIVIFSFIAFVTFNIGFYVGTIYAQSSSTATLEKFSFAKGSSVTILRDGNTYYSFNATTGAKIESGTNGTQIWQNVINSLTNGGKIFFKGIHEVSQIILKYDDLTIEGEGDSSILRATSTNNLISTTSTATLTGIHLRYFQIDGRGLAWNGINFYRDGTQDSVQDSTIEGVYINGTVNAGIRLNNAYKIDILDVNINGHTPVPGTLTTYGIWIESSSGLNIIANGIYYSDQCIRFDGGYDSQILGNSLYYYATSAIQSGSSGYDRAKIIGNKIYGYYLGGANALRGMYLWSFKRSVFIGNTIGNVKRQGIITVNSVSNTFISNTLWDTGQEANNTYPAIQVESNGDSFIGNYFYSTVSNKPSYWFEELSGSSDNLYSNNYFYTDPATADFKFALSSSSKVYHNYGYNPIGYIANAFNTTDNNLRDTGGNSVVPNNATNVWCLQSPKVIYVIGGTMIETRINGQVVFTTQTNITIVLQPGDYVTFTWSVTPTFKVFGQ